MPVVVICFMDLSSLTTFQLFEHFVRINSAYIHLMDRVISEGSFIDRDSLDSLRNQISEAIDELRKRRPITASLLTEIPLLHLYAIGEANLDPSKF